MMMSRRAVGVGPSIHPSITSHDDDDGFVSTPTKLLFFFLLYVASVPAGAPLLPYDSPASQSDVKSVRCLPTGTPAGDSSRATLISGRRMAPPGEEGASSATAELDAPLHAVGFQIDVVSPTLVGGRFRVYPTCCQRFGVLHGGVSALVAESLASMGAHVASGFRRVAGVQLSINHHRPAALGVHVLAEARPVSLGKTIQVWEVKLWKAAAASDEGVPDQRSLLASSRVTLLVNLPVPEGARQAEERLRKHAKL